MKKRYLIIPITILLVLVAAILNSNLTLLIISENKVWAHRVNSFEKLTIAKEKFKGVELDVVFKNTEKESFFDVRHPSDSSINLSLTEYFQSIQRASEYGYWLDFKNLNQKNEISSSVKLDSIITVFNIDKAKIIVESSSPQYLNSFKEKGFRTSYYLPVNLRKLDPKVLGLQIETIIRNIFLYKNSYISADYRDYPIIKKHFPEEKKIFWFPISGSMNRIKERLLLYNILFDKNVDILLIPVYE